ncbi:ceramide glucosyltransferase-B-like [Ruditapes philippinarum]|uniref:ceramide glucosyltransferase-B-like n=1 Tax=Ruditapes philippinarum TaxID=129788 RepID=UPI00295BF94F|nr:ceramide glucosyltransferase-B-like [Ruditapes philippinarum]
MSVVEIILLSISIAALGGWLLTWFIHTVALIYGIRKLHKPSPQISPEDLQGVSIIKPLVGVDSNLYYNLETFFNIKYPAYELLFSVHDEQDPAIMIVQKLIERYPKVDAKLFIGMKYVGPNGKVNNMMKPFEACKYDLVNISDSSIKASPEVLMDMVGHMTADTGLVLQMPFCCDRKGFAAIYEKVFFGTMQARNMLTAIALGINCSTGMSSMIRKEIVERAGGLQHFAQYLAEDFFLAHQTVQQGFKVKLSNMLAMQNSGAYSVDHFHQRLTRWGRLRVATVPTLLVLEPLSECILQGLLISWCVEYLFGLSSMAFFLMHVLVWFLVDYTLLNICQNGPLPFSKFEFLCAWLFRECTSSYLSLKGHFSSAIVWRHRKYRLRWGGTIEEI